MLSNNQEIALNFLNTHFSMTTLLMPWKRTTLKVVAVGTADVVSNQLYSLFNLANIDTWKIGMSSADPPVAILDDDLNGRVHMLIGVAVALLLFTIMTLGSSILYPRELKGRFGLDFISLVLSSTLLVLSITFQDGFDAYWKQIALGTPSGTTLDWEQMFLVVGVLVGQIVVNLTLFGDKVKDVGKSLE